MLFSEPENVLDYSIALFISNNTYFIINANILKSINNVEDEI